MRIIIADSAGFCMGVRRAVNMVLELVEKDQEPVCSIGSLIHNPQVVELLRKRGVKPVSSLDEIERGRVIIRSHGISPRLREKLEQKGMQILDATCPRVARVHRAVEKYSGLGYLIVVLGDPGHSEVEGILGFAAGRAQVVQSPEDVKNLPAADQVVFLAQTTQSLQKFEAVAEALKSRYPGLKDERLIIINTLCDSTERRQSEIRMLAKKVDALVIVGGRESANTKRLQEIAVSEGKPAYLVESEQEIDFDQLRGLKTIGLTAGASTPNWMIWRVYEELKRMSLGEQKFLIRIMRQAARLIAILNIYLAAGGALLSLLALKLITGQAQLFPALAAFFYLASISNFKLIFSPRMLSIIEPARGKIFSDHRFIILYLSYIGLIVGGLFIYPAGFRPLVFYIGLCLLSVIYQTRFIEAKKRAGAWIRSLVDFPGSQNIFSAAAWSAMIALIPLLGRKHLPASAWILFALFFLMTLGRGIIQDFRGLQSDRMVGRQTLPVLLGPARSRMLVHSLTSSAMLLLIAALAAGVVKIPAAGIGLGLVWLSAAAELFARKKLIPGLAAEILADSGFILAAAAGLALSKI